MTGTSSRRNLLRALAAFGTAGKVFGFEDVLPLATSYLREMPDMLAVHFEQRLNGLAAKWDTVRAKVRSASESDAPATQAAGTRPFSLLPWIRA